MNVLKIKTPLLDAYCTEISGSKTFEDCILFRKKSSKVFPLDIKFYLTIISIVSNIKACTIYICELKPIPYHDIQFTIQ